MRRQQRPAGTIFTSSVSKEKHHPLSDVDINTQRTVVRDRKNSVATTFTNKWAYDYDNQESSKISKETSNQYFFESFNEPESIKNIENQNCIQFASFKAKNSKFSKPQAANNQDSLAQYQKMAELELGENDIVKKLTCLNNVFKEIKLLRAMDLSQIIQKSLSGVEDKLLAIERAIIRDETKKQSIR